MHDGRQSKGAWLIARGVMRMWRGLGHACISELPLASRHRADIVSLDRSNRIHIAEIKSCEADFRSDYKWQHYTEWCDEFYFAIDNRTPQELIPQEAGLILADAYGAEIIRRPQARTAMAGARRKAVTLRFAQAAAWRLQGSDDPNAV